MILAEELVVHACYALDGFVGDGPYLRIRAIWGALRSLAGDPISSLPTDLPAGPAGLPADHDAEVVIAGQQGPDCQAVVRRRHDVLILSVGFTADTNWADLERAWDRALGDGDDLLGETRIYYGRLSGTPEAGAATARLAHLPPVPQDPHWQSGGVLVDAGCAVWEVSPRVDSRTTRRLLVLGADERDAQISALLWSTGDPAAPPLARYLLHAAKLRYQLRVLETGGLPGLRARVAAVPRGDHALRDLELDVVAATTELAVMRRTVEIAADNMRRHLATMPGAVQGGLFAEDSALAADFQTRLDDELAYLRADQDLLRTSREILATSRGGWAHSEDCPTVGILTAMPLEYHPVWSMMRDRVELSVQHDQARYTRGWLPSNDPDRPHQIVLAMTGDTATYGATDGATNLSRSFPTVDCLIMTGVAAGVPDIARPDRHVRLGDIVVASWGVVDYAHVVVRDERIEQRQPFPLPWPVLRTTAKLLEAGELGGERPWEQWLDPSGDPLLNGYQRPADEADLLIPIDPGGRRPRHPSRIRSGHRPGLPKVHQGRIGSANVSLRSGRLRDLLASEHNIRAFEMEGAGVGASAFLNDRHWFMVRGVSDYADRGFDSRWRKYAALAAAAYVRALLAACPPISQ
jgi:nucleoside phosphorylase